MPTVNKLFLKVFLLITILFEGTFTLFFKDKETKRSHKTVRIKTFLLHVDPVDPDPEQERISNKLRTEKNFSNVNHYVKEKVRGY